MKSFRLPYSLSREDDEEEPVPDQSRDDRPMRCMGIVFVIVMVIWGIMEFGCHVG